MTELLVAASQKASDTTVTDTSLRTEDGGGKQGSVSPQPENRHNRDQRENMNILDPSAVFQEAKFTQSLTSLTPTFPTQNEMLSFTPVFPTHRKHFPSAC